MKRILLLLTLSSLGASASAVFFGVPGANEQFHWVTTDNNGNIYVSGKSTSGGVTDLLAASFNSSGTVRWSNVFDGGFNTTEVDDALDVYNSNVTVAYRTGQTFGTQVFSRVGGVPISQTTYMSPTLLSTNNATAIANNAIFVGSRNTPGFTDGFALRMDGINPPTPVYFGTSGYTIFRESVTTAAGTYIAVRDAVGSYICQWDFATGTAIWTTYLPAGVTADRIAADNAGNLYVGGTVLNTTRDLTVCKYSPTGAFLGQGTADSGYEDACTHMIVVGNKPVLAGFHSSPTGQNWIYCATFRANLTRAEHFHDQVATASGNLATDGSVAYLIGRTNNGTDFWLYKFDTTGVYWGWRINQSPLHEEAFGLIYKSGMLLVCGWTSTEAFVNRIDPAVGTVIW